MSGSILGSPYLGKLPYFKQPSSVQSGLTVPNFSQVFVLSSTSLASLLNLGGNEDFSSGLAAASHSFDIC